MFHNLHCVCHIFHRAPLQNNYIIRIAESNDFSCSKFNQRLTINKNWFIFTFQNTFKIGRINDPESKRILYYEIINDISSQNLWNDIEWISFVMEFSFFLKSRSLNRGNMSSCASPRTYIIPKKLSCNI